jgi:hypothetical protein
MAQYASAKMLGFAELLLSSCLVLCGEGPQVACAQDASCTATSTSTSLSATPWSIPQSSSPFLRRVDSSMAAHEEGGIERPKLAGEASDKEGDTMVKHSESSAILDDIKAYMPQAFARTATEQLAKTANQITNHKHASSMLSTTLSLKWWLENESKLLNLKQRRGCSNTFKLLANAVAITDRVLAVFWCCLLGRTRAGGRSSSHQNLGCKLHTARCTHRCLILMVV